MTKPQIWVSVFLFLFIVLFIIGRFTKKEEQVKEFTSKTNNPNTELSSENLTGAELFVSFGCINCHSRNLDGTSMGPPLANLTEHWGRETLIAYLRNPSSFMGGERFKEYRKKYSSQIMPAFGEKDVKDLGKIADYLLGF